MTDTVQLPDEKQQVEALITIMSVMAAQGDEDAQRVMDDAQSILSEGWAGLSEQAQLHVLQALEKLKKQGRDILSERRK